ncbi:hypothetical protein N9V96_04415 [Polaribacter sp.]|nr:hypothetical protein [Polaribacter sp.]
MKKNINTYIHYSLAVIIGVILVSITSCRKDFSTIPSFGDLEFSQDTVFLDTVFTNIGSSTYSFKVYNKSDDDITIPNITLENGSSSNYRLNVDGIAGSTFDDIDILANDSIFVFVETTSNTNGLNELLYTDKVLFDNGNNQQDVDLVTLVKDATFIFPARDNLTMKIDTLILDNEATSLQGRFLTDDELVFTNEKPTVIYGFAAVPEGKTLTIEAGARVHFHDNSGLIVDTGATLNVNGTLNEKVIFEGDRLESNFDDVSAQWGAIWLRAGSVNNVIEHAVIKNAVVGLLVDGATSFTNPTLTLENSEIYNHSSFGILGRNTNISAGNIVIGDAGQASLAATFGGVYNFTHCTFANFWSNSLRQLPTVLVNNFFTFEDENGEEVTEVLDLISSNFVNCIIEGNNNIEFILDRVEGSAFNYNVSNCLLQFEDANDDYIDVPEMDFSNEFYTNIILNGNADFRNSRDSDFIIGEESDAINQAISSVYPTDILGVDRTTSPDIGAYQHIIFEEEED